MVVLGAHLHKRSHTIVVVDLAGRKLADKTVPATPEGHLEVRRAVPTPRPGAAEGWRLPVARLDGPERDVRRPRGSPRGSRGRPDAAINRLRWHLHELLPGREPKPRSLDRAIVLRELDVLLGPLEGTVPRIARYLVARIRELTMTIDALAREIAGAYRTPRAVAACAPGLRRVVRGQARRRDGGSCRFRRSAQFARHNGTAPVRVWPGDTVRHRLSRGGNGQLNVVLHRIAITQIRLGAAVRTYFGHRLAAGDTKTEAIRALRRRISDEVFRRLRHDEAARADGANSLPVAACHRSNA